MSAGRAEYDIVVVGLGGLGSAAAYWLARRGARVLGLEQYELGHDRGASQDHSRIIRRSYHTPGYVRLAAGAYEAWATVEADLGQPLLVRTGGLDLFPPGAAIAPEPYRESLAAEGVPAEWLDGAEARRRWPPLVGLADAVGVLFQADAGIAPAAAGNAAHQRLAREHGAVLREGQRVRTLHPARGEVVVVTDDEEVRAGHVLLCADAWTNRLLEPLGAALPLEVTREQVTYYDSSRLADFQPERVPVWIWMDDPSYYGFPVFGEAAIKAAEDCGGLPVDPDTRSFDPDPGSQARLTEFMRGLFGDAIGAVRRSKTCLYTLTPDRDFVLDRLAEHPEIVVALGSAHGYKFASWFGRTLAEMVLDGETDADLTPFRLDRPALVDPATPRTWLV